MIHLKLPKAEGLRCGRLSTDAPTSPASRARAFSDLATARREGKTVMY